MTPHGLLAGIKAADDLHPGNDGEDGPGDCGLLEGAGTVVAVSGAEEEFDGGLDPVGAGGGAGGGFVVD